jgi:hypothetical protein
MTPLAPSRDGRASGGICDARGVLMPVGTVNRDPAGDTLGSELQRHAFQPGLLGQQARSKALAPRSFHTRAATFFPIKGDGIVVEMPGEAHSTRWSDNAPYFTAFVPSSWNANTNSTQACADTLHPGPASVMTPSLWNGSAQLQRGLGGHNPPSAPSKVGHALATGP